MWMRGREREEVHTFAKDDSDLYGEIPQFGLPGNDKIESLTSTV